MYTHHKNDIQQYNDDPAHSAEETHPGPVSDSANYIHSYYTMKTSNLQTIQNWCFENIRILENMNSLFYLFGV